MHALFLSLIVDLQWVSSVNSEVQESHDIGINDFLQFQPSKNFIDIKAFELSQGLMGKWLTADYATKRLILEIVCLNFSLVDVSLCPIWRKPFDVLAEGLSVQLSRGERI